MRATRYGGDAIKTEKKPPTEQGLFRSSIVRTDALCCCPHPPSTATPVGPVLIPDTKCIGHFSRFCSLRASRRRLRRGFMQGRWAVYSGEEETLKKEGGREGCGDCGGSECVCLSVELVRLYVLLYAASAIALASASRINYTAPRRMFLSSLRLPLHLSLTGLSVKINPISSAAENARSIVLFISKFQLMFIAQEGGGVGLPDCHLASL